MNFFINLFRPNLANSLVNQNHHDNLNKKKFDINHKKEKVYVIRRKPSPTGFFSNFTFVFNNLIKAKKKGYNVLVDMENYPTIYNEKNKIFNTYNSWEYYFKQTSKKSINLKYNYKKLFFSKLIFTKDMEKNLDKLKKNKYALKILNNYIKIQDIHKKELKKKLRKKFNNKKILGVQISGTTQKIVINHQLPIMPEQLIKEIEKIFIREKCHKIFLVTEDLQYFNILKKYFKNKIIYLNSFRSSASPFGNHIKAFTGYPRQNHRYNLGREILIEALMLSNCDVILYSDSNVSRAAILFSKINQKKYEINTSLNSKYVFIARWRWYIHRLLFRIGFKFKYKILEKNH